MKCETCGFENKEDSHFCEKCGTRLTPKQNPLRKNLPLIIVAIAVLCIAVIVVVFVIDHTEDIAVSESDEWKVTGQSVECDSLCDLRPESSGPSSVKFAGKFTITGCGTLDDQFQQPLAILITVQNITSEKYTLTIPLISDVILHSGGETENALALCIPSQWLMMGGGCSWVTTEEGGTLQVDIEPNESVELLYLFPHFEGEAIIELLDIGSFKIEI
jgi:predicted nucleic acid-binding Zn ribbon protein